MEVDVIVETRSVDLGTPGPMTSSVNNVPGKKVTEWSNFDRKQRLSDMLLF